MTVCKVTEEDVPQKPQIRAASDYCGNIDDSLRQGVGCQSWKTHNTFQSYTGQFLDNNLHGGGQYTYKNEQVTKYMNGCFYNNKLEGYAQVVYEDESYFEGLFKKNQKFGPGIWTRQNETQDVGIWTNDVLIRLSVVVQPCWMPCMGRTPSHKATLLKFRDLVKVKEEKTDIAKEVLRQLGASEKLLSQSHRLYNPEIRNENSLFFNRSKYDEAFYSDDCCAVEVEVIGEESELVEVPSKQCRTSYQTPNSQEEIQFTACLCATSISERFTQLCVQLNEVDLKLASMKGRLSAALEKIKECEFCCKKFGYIKSSDDKIIGVPTEVSTMIASIQYSDQETYIAPVCLALNHTESDSLADDEDTQPNSMTIRDNIFCEEAESSAVQNYLNEVAAQQEMDENEMEEHDSGESEKCVCSPACNVDDIRFEIEFTEREIRILGHLRNLVKACLDQEYDRSTEPRAVKTKKVVISDLVAWNNQETNKELLRHCFVNRHTENLVTFKPRQLLCGRRQNFGNCGVYEEACIRFLLYCCKGDNEGMWTVLADTAIHPDLCDAKGNSGVLFASARDRRMVLRTLINLGANIDMMNDEGLTPLSLNICRLVSLTHRFTDWGSALLPEGTKEGEENETGDIWNASRSMLSLASLTVHTMMLSPELQSKITMDSVNLKTSASGAARIEEIHNKLDTLELPTDTYFQGLYEQGLPDQHQDYVLHTHYVKVTRGDVKSAEQKAKKSKVRQDKKANKKPASKKSPKKTATIAEGTASDGRAQSEHNDEDNVPSPKRSQTQRQLHIVLRTILTILNCGANPNLGTVPMPPLLLSMFTKFPEVVEELLKFGADPNVRTSEDNLTPLHILCARKLCQESVDMCHLLMSYNADANLRSDSDHWQGQKEQLLAGNQADGGDIKGKTPLHTLCIREDFANAEGSFQLHMAKMISSASDIRALYVGHTALSLAVVRGNAPMIKFLLENSVADPHQPLGDNMGNVLTVHFLKRYPNLLPLETCKSVLELLLSSNVNPFRRIQGTGNAIEFIVLENLTPPKEGKKKDKGKGAKESKGKKKSSKTKQLSKSTSSKKSRTSKTAQQQLIEYMYDACRKYILRSAKGRAVYALYTLFEEAFIDQDLMVTLAMQVTTDEALQILKRLFNTGTIEAERYDEDICKCVLHFVEKYGLQSPSNEKKGKKLKKETKKSKQNVGSEKGKKSSKQKISSKGSSKKSKGPSREGSKTQSVSSQRSADHDYDIDKAIGNTDFNILPKKDIIYHLPPPEIEVESKVYKVCFHCLKATGDSLILCPRCCLIYFCSEECNRESNRQKNGHTCEQFYKAEKKIYDRMLEEDNAHDHEACNRLNASLQKAKEQLEERRRIARREEEIQFLEESAKKTINTKKAKLLGQQLEYLRNEDSENYNKISKQIELLHFDHTPEAKKEQLPLKHPRSPFHHMLKSTSPSDNIPERPLSETTVGNVRRENYSTILEKVSEIKIYSKEAPEAKIIGEKYSKNKAHSTESHAEKVTAVRGEKVDVSGENESAPLAEASKITARTKGQASGSPRRAVSKMTAQSKDHMFSGSPSAGASERTAQPKDQVFSGVPAGESKVTPQTKDQLVSGSSPAGASKRTAQIKRQVFSGVPAGASKVTAQTKGQLVSGSSAAGGSKRTAQIKGQVFSGVPAGGSKVTTQTKGQLVSGSSAAGASKRTAQTKGQLFDGSSSAGASKVTSQTKDQLFSGSSPAGANKKTAQSKGQLFDGSSSAGASKLTSQTKDQLFSGSPPAGASKPTAQSKDQLFNGSYTIDHQLEQAKQGGRRSSDGEPICGIESGGKLYRGDKLSVIEDAATVRADTAGAKIPRKGKVKTMNKIQNHPNYSLMKGTDGAKGDTDDMKATVGNSRMRMNRPVANKFFEKQSMNAREPRKSEVRDAHFYNICKDVYGNKQGPKDTFSDIVQRRKISKRAHHLAKLLAKHFPDMDFSSVTMPFVCYIDGQILYTFNDDCVRATFSQM